MTYTEPRHSMPSYLTKKKRKLTGKRLETFNKFWNIFDYKKGRAEAADSWLDIPLLTDSIVADIFLGAKAEAIVRQRLLDTGKTPKMAQGWLSGRRWEDPAVTVKPISFNPGPGNGVDLMVRALNILMNIGKAEFESYCKQTKMPPGDIEAVLYKSKGKYKTSDVNRLVGGIG
jgi:hypothetical protein